MSKTAIKYVYSIGLLVWCAGIGLLVFLASRKTITGSTALVAAIGFLVPFVGSYVWLEMKGKT